MKIIFIRHGKTLGNIEKKYIGSTDQPLCKDGIAGLESKSFECCEKLICSPMKRCIETAEIIFPKQQYEICEDLRECDFGIFEGKDHEQLNGNAEYQHWIDSGGMGDFPGGEAPLSFKQRCIRAFENVTAVIDDKTSVSFVVHGGTIMAIMERYALPKRSFYEWSIGNGCGYKCCFDRERITDIEKI